MVFILLQYLQSPVCTIKPISEDITSVFKLFYEKVERCHTKGKVWSGIKTLWTIQNSYPVIPIINNLNKHKAAKGMSTFDFSMPYTKLPHDKLLYVLNELTGFAFEGGARDFVTVYNSGAFWPQSKSKFGRSYSPRNKNLFGFFNKQELLPGRF